MENTGGLTLKELAQNLIGQVEGLSGLSQTWQPLRNGTRYRELVPGVEIATGNGTAYRIVKRERGYVKVIDGEVFQGVGMDVDINTLRLEIGRNMLVLGRAGFGISSLEYSFDQDSQREELFTMEEGAKLSATLTPEREKFLRQALTDVSDALSNL